MQSDEGKRPASQGSRGVSTSFTEIEAFDVVHRHLAWPWLAFDAKRSRVAFAASETQIASRVLFDGRVTEGPTFALPADLALPTTPTSGPGAPGAGADGFAIASDGALLGIIGTVDGASVVVTSDNTGERARSGLEALAGKGLRACAVAFDRSGTRLWISAESATETALLLLDAQTHAVVGVARSAPFPPPAMHELHVHPQDDAVLLLAACGEDGTFARVVGWAGGDVTAVPTALDAGGVSAGFVGFSADAARVHLAEADELRTHAWPGLEELSSVELVDDFVSSYSGAVLGERIFVDGEDAESREDAVMTFDRAALRGTLVMADVPTGMWAGRLGADLVVTVEAKGDPARGRIVRVAL
jgi:hypothetical protein